MSISISSAGTLSLASATAARAKPSIDGFGFTDLTAPAGQTLSAIPYGASAKSPAPPNDAAGTSPSESTSLSALLSRRNTKLAAGAQQSATANAQASFDQMFSQSDANHDGVLSKDEFENFDTAVNPSGAHLTVAATGEAVDGAYMFSAIDRNGLGHITREQAARYAQVNPDGTMPTTSLDVASA